MIPPDKEIHEVETRIAARRAQFARHTREARSRALRKLSSPAALIGAAALGFLVVARVAARPKQPPHPERRKTDHMKAAKATGIVGTLCHRRDVGDPRAVRLADALRPEHAGKVPEPRRSPVSTRAATWPDP